jgi:hypothetical protein
MVCSNNIVSGGGAFANGWGCSTNISFVNNAAVDGSAGLDSSSLTGQWYFDDLSNTFPFYNNDDFVGGINSITYTHGTRQNIWVSKPNSIWALDDTHPKSIPPGAQMIVQNYNNGQTCPTALYLSASRSAPPIALAVGQTAMVRWTNDVWQLISEISAPTDLRVISGSP